MTAVAQIRFTDTPTASGDRCDASHGPAPSAAIPNYVHCDRLGPLRDLDMRGPGCWASGLSHCHTSLAHGRCAPEAVHSLDAARNPARGRGPGRLDSQG